VPGGPAGRGAGAGLPEALLSGRARRDLADAF
jgi:hypothetical protein